MNNHLNQRGWPGGVERASASIRTRVRTAGQAIGNWSEQRDIEDGEAKGSKEQTVGFSVKNAVLFPPEVEKGRASLSPLLAEVEVTLDNEAYEELTLVSGTEAHSRKSSSKAQESRSRRSRSSTGDRGVVPEIAEQLRRSRS
ncbi:hypothetical protein F2Q68_00021648 [Brassica cretica]|uniref:Uncharacterized protein n=1 Tax=Brassica cretica TaxID=69181 RepID=A0A8S9FWV8_BRACR|nr:hypothetical protein F2Q68_00021648 [Brassica cretica]